MKELGIVRRARPCNRRWWRLEGDDRVRRCDGCRQNVYDLSGLNSTDARALLLAREGRLCVRFWQREDGTVLTRSCPSPRRALLRVLTAAVVFVIVVVVLTLFGDNQPRLFDPQLAAELDGPVRPRR